MPKLSNMALFSNGGLSDIANTFHQMATVHHADSKQHLFDKPQLLQCWHNGGYHSFGSRTVGEYSSEAHQQATCQSVCCACMLCILTLDLLNRDFPIFCRQIATLPSQGSVHYSLLA